MTERHDFYIKFYSLEMDEMMTIYLIDDKADHGNRR